MKALIMSDSHGWTTEVQNVVKRHADEVDAIFHCGDSELSSTSAELDNVHTVRGNCDFGGDFPEKLVKEVEGYRFFVAHGHLLNVKMTEMNLLYKAQEQEAAIACFGHTHVPVAVKEEGIIILNPGSMRLPRNYPVGTYIILEAFNNQVKVNFYSIDGKLQKELSKVF